MQIIHKIENKSKLFPYLFCQPATPVRTEVHRWHAFTHAHSHTYAGRWRITSQPIDVKKKNERYERWWNYIPGFAHVRISGNTPTIWRMNKCKHNSTTINTDTLTARFKKSETGMTSNPVICDQTSASLKCGLFLSPLPPSFFFHIKSLNDLETC